MQTPLPVYTGILFFTFPPPPADYGFISPQEETLERKPFDFGARKP